jgi:hypothetical protein
MFDVSLFNVHLSDAPSARSFQETSARSATTDEH